MIRQREWVEMFFSLLFVDNDETDNPVRKSTQVRKSQKNNSSKMHRYILLPVDLSMIRVRKKIIFFSSGNSNDQNANLYQRTKYKLKY